MRRILVAFVVVTLAAVGLTVAALPGSAISTDVNVPGTAGGPDNGGTAAVSTGIVIPDGASVTINASGTVFICGPGGCANGPDGGTPGNSTANSLVPSSPYGCLAARVGSGAWECIGSSGILDGPGEIQFGVNDDFVGPGVGYEDNSGSFTVVVGQPRQTVTLSYTATGTAPTTYTLNLLCSSEPLPEAGSIEAAADAELVLGPNDATSVAVEVQSGSSKTVDVWWPVSGVENVTCTLIFAVPAVIAGGPICNIGFSPTSQVLFDVSDEINQPGSFAVTQNCVTPVPAPPTFTG
jgi:hypothetical protein